MRPAAVVAVALALVGAARAEVSTLDGHGGPVMAIAAAPDGRVATASFDNAVGLWTDGVPTWLDGHDAAATAVVVLPDGALVSGGDDFAVIHWQGGTPRLLGRHLGKVQALSVLPGGEGVASASWDGTVRLWSLDGAPGGAAIDGPGGAANALAVSPDGAALFIGTAEGVVWRHDLGSGEGRALVRHGFGINEVVAGEGWLAYGAADGVTRVIDPVTAAAVADYTLDRRPILAMAHHAPTGRLAMGDGDGWIMVLDTADWSLVEDFRAMARGPVWALAFAADGATLYAGGIDDAVHAWPVAALAEAETVAASERSFLRDPETMANGERQFMRKCSVCHELTPGPSRRAGPTLHGLFGRVAGTVPGYRYSRVLDEAELIWDETTVAALFEQGPDHYVPGSKMPMQVIAAQDDRADLVAYLRRATEGTE